MSEVLPTILVKRKEDNHVCLINLSEFDEKLHEAVGSENQSGFDREAAKKALDEKGVKYAKNASDTKLQELLDEANKPQPELSVVEKDGKFVIVNKDGEQQGDEQFDKEEDAKVMVELLTGKK